MKIKLMFITSCMAIASFAGAQPNSFKMFHQVRYSNTPTSLSPYLLPFKISNESVLLNAADSTPNQAAIQNFALTCPSGVPVCLDLETWPYYPNSKLTNTINKFLSTINFFKAVNVVSPIGFYGVAPKQAYEWSSIDPVNNPGGYSTWKRISDSFARVAVNIDVFQPSFYAYEADTSSWRKMVDTTIAATKRYSTTKPIYAWIWPQYHQSSRPNQLEFIDTAIWRFQLETLYKRTNGVIIWSSNKTAAGATIYWDPNMPWWQVTKSFMVEKSLAVPFVLDSFNVKRTGNSEFISWTTSIDTTTNQFIIERSLDGISFLPVGSPVYPSSTYYTQNSYQYTDNGSGSNLYYRLKIIKKDASITYSNTATAFAAGILAVLRIGGVNGTNGTAGSSTPGTAGSPMHIDKYSVSAGVFTYQSSIDLPAKSASMADTIFASSSISEGYITQSANKQFLSVMGYAAKATSGTIYSTPSNGIARTLGLIKYDGSIDISTKLSNFPLTATTTAATAETAISNNGTDLWCVTAQGGSPMGVLSTTPGSTNASTQASIVTTATPYYSSIRSLSIVGGDLYWCAASLNRIGTVSATGGLPTTAGSSNMTPISIATGSTPINNLGASQIVMFDLDSSIVGYDVMYITNTTTTAGFSGIYKYCKNAADKWVSFGTFGTTSTDGIYFGITGEVISGLPVLYVTRGISATQNLVTNQLMQLTEASGYNVNMNVTVSATTDATVSGMSGVLRGVAFFPSASFYYNGTGNLNDVTSWGTNLNGTGTTPANFSNDEQTFFITNGSAATLSADLIISGINSKIILGDGTNATSLTIPPTFSIAGEMDVYNNAVLNIQNVIAPNLHFVAKNSTVNFSAVSNQTIKTMAYGNFINNNNSAASINGIVTVANTITQNGLLKGNATLIVPNGILNNGIIAPGNSPGLFSITGNFTNATAGKLAAELGGNTTAGVDYDLLAVSGNVTIAGTLNITLVNSFVPVIGQIFTIITSPNVTGTFGTVNWPAGVTGTINYTATSVEINISTVVLPINLLSFTGSVLQTGPNQLNWKTANEINVDHFKIERSENGILFKTLLTQASLGNRDNSYSINDNYPLNGINYYRLKIVEKNGRFTFSNIIILKNNSISKSSAFPNPTKGNLNVIHALADNQSFIQIIQIDGKVVLTQSVVKGSIQTAIDLSNLKLGIYLVKVSSHGEINTYKIVKE